jgi:hypothetical protein
MIMAGLTTRCITSGSLRAAGCLGPIESQDRVEVYVAETLGVRVRVNEVVVVSGCFNLVVVLIVVIVNGKMRSLFLIC